MKGPQNRVGAQGLFVASEAPEPEATPERT